MKTPFKITALIFLAILIASLLVAYFVPDYAMHSVVVALFVFVALIITFAGSDPTRKFTFKVMICVTCTMAGLLICYIVYQFISAERLRFASVAWLIYMIAMMLHFIIQERKRKKLETEDIQKDKELQ